MVIVNNKLHLNTGRRRLNYQKIGALKLDNYTSQKSPPNINFRGASLYKTKSTEIYLSSIICRF